MVPPSSRQPQQPPPTWLEQLPQTAINLIVAALQQWYRFKEATTESCALAFTSDSLRQSVQKSLQHEVHLSFTEDLAPAVTLFSSGIKSLRIFSVPTQHPELIHFLRAPTLESVRIPADESLASALLVKKSVRHLEIEIDAVDHVVHVATLLRELPLTKLSLSCYIDTPAKACLFNSELSDPQHENCIAELCPDLEELNIICSRDDRNAIFWRMFPKLSLKRARLQRNVRTSVTHQLRSMESVALDNVKDPVYHAERLGGCVTVFQTMDILDSGDLRIMHACPRIRVLDISVEVQYSDELCELVGLLLNLKVLKLTFNRHRMYSGKRGRTGCDRMGDGDGVRLIKAAESLEELDLMGLQIPGEEMMDMLRVLGGRLKRFRTCIRGQEEPMFERLERLLECLCRFNYGLEAFGVWESYEVSGIKSNVRRKGKGFAKRRRQQKEVGKRLSSLLDVLKRRSRWIDGGSHGQGVGALVDVLL